MRTVVLAVLATAALAAAAGAATVTITLDNVTVSAPDITWSEAGLDLWFCATTDEDRTPGYCLVLAHVEAAAGVGVYIYPARLNVDLSVVEGLETVEVDVYETHFPGSTRAFLYADGAPVASAQSVQELTHTLTLATGGQAVDHLAVSAHESAVWEIRLIGAALVPDAAASFGAVKALYR